MLEVDCPEGKERRRVLRGDWIEDRGRRGERRDELRLIAFHSLLPAFIQPDTENIVPGVPGKGGNKCSTLEYAINAN